jgi:hypothetical protein
LRSTRELIAQVQGLTGPQELRPLVEDLGRVTRPLPRLTVAARQTFQQVTPLMRCLDRTVIPALNLVAPDGNLSTGDPAWLDFMHFGAGLGGSSPGFDGNGSAIRLGATEGPRSLTNEIPGLGQFVTTGTGTGIRPLWLGPNVEPPLRPDAPCDRQAQPDLTQRAAGPPTGTKSVPTRAMDADDHRVMRLMAGALTSERGKERLRQYLLGFLDLPDRSSSTPKRTGPRTSGPKPATPSPTASAQPTATRPPIVDVRPLIDKIPLLGDSPVIDGASSLLDQTLQNLTGQGQRP